MFQKENSLVENRENIQEYTPIKWKKYKTQCNRSKDTDRQSCTWISKKSLNTYWFPQKHNANTMYNREGKEGNHISPQRAIIYPTQNLYLVQPNKFKS